MQPLYFISYPKSAGYRPRRSYDDPGERKPGASVFEKARRERRPEDTGFPDRLAHVLALARVATLFLYTS